jgi:hypothetical protein
MMDGPYQHSLPQLVERPLSATFVLGLLCGGSVIDGTTEDAVS